MRCEAYDTLTDHWFQTESLPMAHSGTNPIVLNNQDVYLFPKITHEGKGSNMHIYRLLTGASNQFSWDPARKNGGYPLAQHRWESFQVKNNNDFI